MNFNPLSPQRERLSLREIEFDHETFQSTLPAKGETIAFWTPAEHIRFQSTLPAKGETRRPDRPRPSIKIFQSTLPAKGETIKWNLLIRSFQFQSTLPAKGETDKPCTFDIRGRNFNPLSPQRERRRKVKHKINKFYFNPLSPQRERQL